MRLLRIGIANVRNYVQLELEPAPGLNLFVGPNAQGKSNLLEAIAMLATGKSFRTNRELEIVREGESLAVFGGNAMAAAGEIRLSCTITIAARAARKVYGVNGGPVRYASYLGKIRMVSFTPENLFLVNGPPLGRRAFLNSALAQENPAYYAALANYNRAVVQKAALLRNPEIDYDLMAVYDERLITHGTKIILARRSYVAALAERAAAVYRRLAERSGEELGVAYAPNIPGAESSESDIAGAFAERLKSTRTPERLRRTCLTGPHRDDLLFTLDGRALHTFGSQGQRRSAVLALKVAEYGVMRERSGEAPLLLLDDVLSELDAVRRERFLQELGGVEQAFVTAVAAPKTLVPAQAWSVERGVLQRLGAAA